MNEFLGFRKMVSPVIIKIIYFLGAIALTFGGFGALFAGEEAAAFGFLALTIGNLIWRVICESWILLFSMHDALISISESSGNKTTYAKPATVKEQNKSNSESSGNKTTYAKSETVKEQNKSKLSLVDYPINFVGEKCYDANTENYLGKISEINQEAEICTIDKDFGGQITRKFDELRVIKPA